MVSLPLESSYRDDSSGKLTIYPVQSRDGCGFRPVSDILDSQTI